MNVREIENTTFSLIQNRKNIIKLFSTVYSYYDLFMGLKTWTIIDWPFRTTLIMGFR